MASSSHTCDEMAQQWYQEEKNTGVSREAAPTRIGCIINGTVVSGEAFSPASDVPHSMSKDKKSEGLAAVIKEMSSPLESFEAPYYRTKNTVTRRQPSYYPLNGSGDTQETDTHSTTKKFLHISDSDHEGSTDSETDSDTDVKTTYPIKDKTNLLRQIENLQKEQEDLKQKQQIHEQHIQELLDHEPCVHKHFKSLRRSFTSEMYTKLSNVSKDFVQSSTSPFKRRHPLILTEQQICVQLEQLYANFHVLHFPSKTAKSILGGHKNSSYSEVDSISEILSLKNKVMELEKKLKSTTEKAPLPPPHPSHGHDLYLNRGRQHDKHEDRVYAPSKELVVVPGRPTSPLPLPPASKDLYPAEVTFKWTISNYSKKLKREKLDEGHKEISCPFYLTHCGYRARMEAYLNGNGTGTNRCMSVFLRVIKGDYDRHLKWPVNLHIVVILVNQSGNHSDSLKAGGNQFQYTKPYGSTDGESDCWGLIEFVSHEMIKQRQYIIDDRIEIKCRVQLLN